MKSVGSTHGLVTEIIGHKIENARIRKTTRNEIARGKQEEREEEHYGEYERSACSDPVHFVHAQQMEQAQGFSSASEVHSEEGTDRVHSATTLS